MVYIFSRISKKRDLRENFYVHSIQKYVQSPKKPMFVVMYEMHYYREMKSTSNCPFLKVAKIQTREKFTESTMVVRWKMCRTLRPLAAPKQYPWDRPRRAIGIWDYSVNFKYLRGVCMKQPYPQIANHKRNTPCIL